MADNKCPICGYNGIPDYHSQDTVCPCCGSDLSIYRVVDSLKVIKPNKETNKKTWLIPFCIASVIAVCFATMCFISNNNRIKAERVNSELTAQITGLNGKISELETTLSEARQSSSDRNDEAFYYTVRNGDSFWTISCKVYGRGKYFTKIVSANNLRADDVLHVGDKLRIPNID